MPSITHVPEGCAQSIDQSPTFILKGRCGHMILAWGTYVNTVDALVRHYIA